MTNLDKILKVYKENFLEEIESSICSKLACKIYTDNLNTLAKFSLDEIEKSKFTICEIRSFLLNNKDSLINFGLLFLKEKKPVMMSRGFSISYSIYLMYLKRNEKEALLKYLESRGISNFYSLFERLIEIKNNINNL